MTDNAMCPFCGAECGLEPQEDDESRDYIECENCGATGPSVYGVGMAFGAFTRPDHLLNKSGFIRLAPDEVVVKRATAETALSVVKSEHLRCLKISEKYRPYDTTIADFTAALNREVTK